MAGRDDVVFIVSTLDAFRLALFGLIAKWVVRVCHSNVAASSTLRGRVEGLIVTSGKNN